MCWFSTTTLTFVPSLCIFCKNVNCRQCQNHSPTLWVYSQHSWSLCLFSWPRSSQRCPRLCCKFHHRMGPTTTNNTLPQPIKISVCLADEWTRFLPIVHVAPDCGLTQPEVLNPVSFSPLVHTQIFIISGHVPFSPTSIRLWVHQHFPLAAIDKNDWKLLGSEYYFREQIPRGLPCHVRLILDGFCCLIPHLPGRWLATLGCMNLDGRRVYLELGK